jgi:ribose 5-phosphate isomerase A
MADLKIEAAKAALSLISAGQTIGMGAGSTVAHLTDMISQRTDLVGSLTLTSSSFKTTTRLLEYGLRVQPPALLKHLDIYFDGCDQFDRELNALKSGGGIHTTEKILASMADEFILIGDEGKFAEQLDTTYPLVIEILPQALQAVLVRLATDYPQSKVNLRMSTQKDGAVISENGNLLADIHFNKLIAPAILNNQIKMIPGIVDHSLFYRMATKAVIAGNEAVRIIRPVYNA